MGNVALKWMGEESQLFVGRDSFGHVVVTGSWPREDEEWVEWKAIKPSDLLVLSLLACSAYDVVMILQRQRQHITGLEISAETTQQPEPPYAFTHIPFGRKILLGCRDYSWRHQTDPRFHHRIHLNARGKEKQHAPHMGRMGFVREHALSEQLWRYL